MPQAPGLQYIPVDIPLARGFDSRSDAKTADPVHLTQLKNATLDKPGALRKREGYTSLGTDVISSSSVLTANAISSHGNTLVAHDATSLYQYSPTAAQWTSRGAYYYSGVISNVEASSATTFRSSLPSGSTEIPAGSASLNSIRVTAWTISDYSTQRGVWYKITDVASGAVLAGPTRKTTISASSLVPVVVIPQYSSGYILVVYPNPDNGKVECYPINTAAVETSLATAVTTSTSTTFGTTSFDAESLGATGTGAVYVHPTSSGNDLQVGFIGATGTFGTEATITATTIRAAKPVSVFTNSAGTIATALFCIDSSGRLGFTMFGTDAVEDTNGIINNSDVTYYQCTGYWSSSTRWHAIWQGNTNTSTAAEAYQIRTATYDNTGSQIQAPATVRYSTALVGAPGNAGSMRSYLVCPEPSRSKTTPAASDSSEYGLILADAYYDATTDPNLANKPNGCVMRGNGFGPRTYLIKNYDQAHGNSARVEFAACDYSGAVRCYEIGQTGTTDELFRRSLNNSANVQGNLYLNGAMSWQFDGHTVVENGFLHTSGPPSTSTTTGGLMTSSRTYTYRIYYEYTDHLNRRVQSGYPYTTTVTLGASDTAVTLVIPTLQWTRRTADGVRIAVYRNYLDTESNLMTTNLYRVDSARNDPSAATITVADLVSDAALSDNEQDYQNADELDNVPFPAAFAMTAAQDRLFAIKAEDPTRVIYSKPLDGDGAVEFNEAQEVPFSEPLRALATFGSTVYAFSESTTYAFSGEGPDNTGLTGGFSSPIIVARNVGVSNPQSVGETPLGIVAVNDNGVWLVGPGGAKSIGDVLTRDSSTSIPFQSVRGIHALPDSTRVRIIGRAYTGGTSVCLEWDYEFNQWVEQSFAETTVRSAVVVGGAYYLAGASVVHKFNSRVDGAGFTDNGTGVAIVAKTAWIRPTGSTLANNRATHGYLLGKDMGHGHSVTVEVAYDYDETFTTVGTFVATGFPQIRFRLPRLSFRAIMFRITEVPDGSPGEGIELSALGLELAQEGTTGGRLLDT